MPDDGSWECDTAAPSLDELPDAVVVVDRFGRVARLNTAAGRLLGTPAGDAVGRDYREVVALHDQDGNDWWRRTDPFTGLRTRVRQPERSLYLPDGREVLVSAAFVRSPRRAGALVRMTISMRDAAHRARQERGRADLVSTVAHELRSPLTSVKGFTATLLAKWEAFTDDQKRVMLETVNADADRVTRLITELLDVSRIESGRLELHRQVVDLADRARRIVAGRVAAGDREDRFVVTAAGRFPDMWLDPDKVDQILGNLLENAVRHGAGTVRIDIEPVEGGAAVSVSDEGEGIAPELIPRVFRQFWRGKRRGGTGLGLYVVKGLVEAHGGDIVVRRAATGGAQFRFTLPAGAPDFA